MKAPLRDRMKELFSAALDMDEPERSDYLEQACAGDSELRQAVADILEGKGTARGFLTKETAEPGLTPVFREGQVVAGRFRIVRFQGRGGMGEVYEAYDERLRLRLGLKTIRADWSLDEEARERFQREILVAREVAHPNLCRVFDLIDDRDAEGRASACLTMEWLEGETLQALLQKRRPLGLEEAQEILTQVAGALDALHAAKIMHRDLKPGNIMLARQPEGGVRAVVMDFGLAKPLTASGAAEWYESTADVQAGAPYFMAPEQLRNEKATMRSDIYAFGLVMDEMVTKSRAFDAGSVGAIYYQRLWEAPIPPSRRADELPAPWEQAILQCLSQDPEQRPESAKAALAPVMGALRPSVPMMAPAPVRRNRAWLAGLLVAPVVIAGAAASWRAPKVEASVVVFPINDLLNEPNFRHLPKGMTAELVNRLSQVEGLSVKQYYGPRDKAPLEAIRERFHLEGDLQKYGKRVRLSLRLTDAEGGNRVVWSDKFDRDMESPLDLQAEVAGRVVQGLEKRVFEEAPAGLKAQYAGLRLTRSLREWTGMTPVVTPVTQSAAAYHLYLRGRQLLDERTPANVEQAIRTLEQGLREDADFGLIHAALSDAQIARIDGNRGDQEALLQVATEHAEQAVRLNPQAPEAHVAMASVRQMKWDWQAAEQSYREAIRLAPRSPVAYRRYGGLIIQFGRFDEALTYVRKGIEMDPYDYPAQSAYGLCLALARRFKEAEEQFKSTLAQSNFLLAHNNLGSVYAAMARESRGEERARYVELALREAAVVRDMERGSRPGDPPTPVSDYMFGLTHAIQGDAVAARRYIEHLRTAANGDRQAPASLALMHAALGERETAVRYLREAARIKDRKLLYLKVLSHWDPIRETKEYQEIVSLMRL